MALERETAVKYKIAWDMPDDPKYREGPMLFMNVKDGFEYARSDRAHWIFDDESILIPYGPNSDNKLHFLETFAGGYGGWHLAASWVAKQCHIGIHTIAVEEDMMKAVQWSIAHDAVLLEATTKMPSINADDYSHDIVLHSDSESRNWWSFVGDWGVDALLISAPCPPWSSASWAPGLDCDQGNLLPATLLLGRVFNPSIIAVEQVQGFSTLVFAHFETYWLSIALVQSHRLGRFRRCHQDSLAGSCTPYPRHIHPDHAIHAFPRAQSDDGAIIEHHFWESAPRS